MASEQAGRDAGRGATPGVGRPFNTLAAPPASPFASPEAPAGSQAGAGGAGGDVPPRQRPPSSASAASVPRSVSSLDPRVSAQLELALSGMRRGDGAREARTLLPGVDLLQTFGMAGDDEDSESGADAEGRGLAVLQTPKGVDLREAVWEAAALQRPPAPAAPAGAARSPSPWEALVSNIAASRASPGSTPPPALPQSASSTQHPPAAGPSREPSASAFVTPPTVPALGEAAAGQLRAASTPVSAPPQLIIDLGALSPAATLPPPSPAGGLLSPGPGPLLTPGAPPSVPLDLRAAAAERLWPLLAPFAPRMLREELLLPAGRRRFVRRAAPGAAPPAPWAASTWRLDAEYAPSAAPLRAAVALADVSGFTALTEAASRGDPGGVELLTRCMNSYFAQVIDLLAQHGGDVAKFAGDAMLIVFEPTAEEAAAAAAAAAGEAEDDGGLAAATRRAAEAVRQLVERYGVVSMQGGGEAVAVPRDQIRRAGSKFVWRNGTEGQPDGVPGRQPVTPRLLAAAAARAGQALSQAAAAVPAAGGFITPWKKARVGDDGASDGAVWLDWLEEAEGGGGGAPGAAGAAPLQIRSEPSSPRHPGTKQTFRTLRSLSRALSGRAAGSTGDLAALDEEEVVTTAGPSSEDLQDQHARRLRSIHEHTLAGFVAEFTGGSILKVRPPELPSGPAAPAAAAAAGAAPLHRGFSSSPSLGGLGGPRMLRLRSGSESVGEGLRSGSAVSLLSGASGDGDDAPGGGDAPPEPHHAGPSFGSAPSFGRADSAITTAGSGGNGGGGSATSPSPRRPDLSRPSAVRRLVTSAFRRGQTRSDRGGAGASTTSAAAAAEQPQPRTGSGSSSSFSGFFGRLRHRPQQHAGDSFTFQRPGGPSVSQGSGSAEGPPAAGAAAPRAGVPATTAPRKTGGGAASADGHLLSLKVTLAAGTLCAYRVGGVMEPTAADCPDAARWEFFVADANEEGASRGPIAQLTATEPLALPGTVIASSEAATLLEGSSKLPRLADGSARLSGRGAAPPDAAAPPPRPSSAGVAAECARLAALPAQARIDAYQALRSHVPFNVRFRVEAGHIDTVNEVRVCTILFVGFPPLQGPDAGGAQGGSGDQGAAALAAVQAAAQAVQGRMHTDGGGFLQMRCDEKGLVALAAFGLPGRVHEDSPGRGVQAALAIVQAVARGGAAAVAGVTTGNLFCGVVGSGRRAEYTVFGDAINLAARLMVRAAAGDGALGPVLCDEPTRWMADGRAKFEALAPLTVKGRTAPLAVYRAAALEGWTAAGPAAGEASPMPPRLLAAQWHADRRARREEPSHAPPELTLQPSGGSSRFDGAAAAAAHDAAAATAPPLAPLIGRDAEMALAARRLAALVEGRGGGAIFVEGDAGTGKTRLAEEVAWGPGLAPLRARCAVLLSAGRNMRQVEPLHPWRRIFRQAFQADAELSAARRALRRGGAAAEGGEPGEGNQEQAPSDLALRLAERLPDYRVWRPVIASALGMAEEELPPAVAPPGPDSGAAAGARVALDEVMLLHLRRAHTIAHLALGAAITAGAGAGPASPPSADPDAVARSMSVRNLDPGRPASASTHSSASRGGSGPASPPALPPAEMSVPLRALKVRGLLVALLREFSACHGPMLIIFDDMHHFDSPSWRLALAVLGALGREVLLLGLLRPVLPLPSAPPAAGAAARAGALPDTPLAANPSGRASLGPAPAFYRKLGAYYEEALWADRAERVALQRFDPGETTALLEAVLGDGVAVPPAAAELLWDKTAGLPAFVYQIASFLKMKGQDAAGGAAAAAAPTLDLAAQMRDFVRATVNVHSIVAERVDRLRPDDALTLKVASVMGATVYADLLAAAHPKAPSPRRLEAQLTALQAAGFITRDPSAGGAGGAASADADGGGGVLSSVWRFKDVLVMDAVYQLVPVLQARDQHARLAHAMARLAAGEGSGSGRGERRRRPIPAAIVAYHFSQACFQREATEWRTALVAAGWWERAAAEAARVGAFEEALTLLRNAAAVAAALAPARPPGLAAHPGLIPGWRRARWERCAAAATLAAGAAPAPARAALGHALRALDLMGVPMPWSQEYLHRKASRGGLLRPALRKLKGRGAAAAAGVAAGGSGSAAAALAGDADALARLVFGHINEETTEEGEKAEAVSVLAAALLVAGSALDGAAALLRYAEWACDRVARDAAEQAPALRALRAALKRAEHGDGAAAGAAGAALLRDLRERVETE